MKALIFASGAGTRFGKLTENKPKAILPLSGIPLIGWILKGLDVAGIDEVYITVGYQGQEIIKEIGESYGNINITYIENPYWEKGNLQSHLVAKDYLNEKFLICMSDHLFDSEIVKNLINQKSKKCVLLAVDNKWPNEDDTKVLAENNLIIDIGKKVRGNYVDTGFFYCSPKVFNYAEDAGKMGHYELSDCMRLAAKNKDAEIFDIENRFWIDIDTRADVATYFARKYKDIFPHFDM